MSKSNQLTASGPWGDVRVEVRSGATCTVMTWVCGILEGMQPGLDKVEAQALAEEILEDRKAELVYNQLNSLSHDDVVSLASALGVFSRHVTDRVTYDCNARRNWPRQQRLEHARRLLQAQARVGKHRNHDLADDVMMSVDDAIKSLKELRDRLLNK